MKTKYILIMLIVLIAGTTVNAQPTSERARRISIFRLDQKELKHTQRVTQLKHIESVKNQIAQNKEQFASLMSIENPDMDEVYKNIDELESLHKQLRKSRIQLFKIYVNFR
jgi:hypothetical protein